MRIIAGKHKGKKLKTFSGYDVRPTSDRARESLFNILAQDVVGSIFLDLCCGTGAMGLEAISRGANKVYFNDLSKESLKITKFNLNSMGEQGEISALDAITFLKTTNGNFDIVFFDPPYEFRNVDGVLKVVLDRNLLTDNGIFIYEHNADMPSKEIQGFNLYDSRKYGIAKFDFYSKI